VVLEGVAANSGKLQANIDVAPGGDAKEPPRMRSEVSGHLEGRPQSEIRKTQEKKKRYSSVPQHRGVP